MDLVQFALALMFLILGYLLKYKKWSWLIAGYNTSSKEEKSKYDTDALCDFMGHFMFVLAALMVVAGIALYLKFTFIFSASWILFVVVIFAAIIYANTGKRFKK